VLDRWVLSELNRLVKDVDAALDQFDTQRAGARLAVFVDDLSNWYVRRSRRRFWDGDPAALATLHECVEVLTRLLAPMVPFVTERVWQDIVRPVSLDAAESVHMAAWPEPDESAIDDVLSSDVALVRRLVELGRAARAASGVRTRQPLARALVGAAGWSSLPAALQAEVADELNVAEISALAESAELVDLTAKANFRTLGRRFGKDTPRVAAAIAAADAQALAAALRDEGRRASVTLAELGEVEIHADDVTFTETPLQGWAVAREGETVALDLSMTEALERAGLAREVVRLLQAARKARGFEVTDRIELAWQAEGELAEALREHGRTVAAEVLATTVHENLSALAGEPDHTATDLGLTFRLRRVAD
jgi:isoleucyl-tRNA synthetase